MALAQDLLKLPSPRQLLQSQPCLFWKHPLTRALSYPLHIPIQPHGYLPMLKTASRIWGGGSVEDLNLVSQTHRFLK